MHRTEDEDLTDYHNGDWNKQKERIQSYILKNAYRLKKGLSLSHQKYFPNTSKLMQKPTWTYS